MTIKVRRIAEAVKNQGGDSTMSEQGKEPWNDSVKVPDNSTKDRVDNSSKNRRTVGYFFLKSAVIGALFGSFFFRSKSICDSLILCFLFLLFLFCPDG